VFANYHRSFRAPQVFSYDFANPNQTLDFEEGENIEVGFRWKGWRGIEGNVVAWTVDFSDFIEFDPFLLVTTNYGGFRSYGVDVTVDADLGRWSPRLCGWSAFASATHQDSEFTVGANDGQKTQFVPRWLLKGGLRYEHPIGFYGLVEGNYHGSSFVTPANDVRTPGYVLCDGRVGFRRLWHRGCTSIEVDAALSSKNLLDREVYLRHTPTLIVPGAPFELFGELALAIAW
jgi:outer membrane receptor protein involved in Fe transport